MAVHATVLCKMLSSLPLVTTIWCPLSTLTGPTVTGMSSLFIGRGLGKTAQLVKPLHVQNRGTVHACGPRAVT